MAMSLVNACCLILVFHDFIILCDNSRFSLPLSGIDKKKSMVNQQTANNNHHHNLNVNKNGKLSLGRSLSPRPSSIHNSLTQHRLVPIAPHPPPLAPLFSSDQPPTSQSDLFFSNFNSHVFHNLPKAPSLAKSSSVMHRYPVLASHKTSASSAVNLHHLNPHRYHHVSHAKSIGQTGSTSLLPECDFNADPAIEHLLDQMRLHLTEEKITVQNGAITIYDARIVRFAELVRLGPTCGRKVHPDGTQVEMSFEAEIRVAHVQAKLKYNFYVTDIKGDYRGNFSHIRMNGTVEANLEEEWMQVTQFNITSSEVVEDSIVFGFVPKWILEWVRSYFDNDNTQMYQQLAKVLLQREADNYQQFALIRSITQLPRFGSINGREEEDRLPFNRL